MRIKKQNKSRRTMLQAGVLFTMVMATVVTPKVSHADNLIIAQNGVTTAQIVVAPDAGQWEKQASADLQKYIEMMTGAQPVLVNTPEGITTALNAKSPVFLMGQEALKVDPSLQKALERVEKKNPVVRADAIVVRREGNRILLAGSNDDSIYYAVSWLLQQWGCRWYMPTDFGECIPTLKVLSVDKLDMAYAPPFEIRKYWLSWNGSTLGQQEFMRRNMMNDELIPSGHILGKYTKDIVPPGKTMFDIPIAADSTAEHVAEQLEPAFAAGKRIDLGMEDGVYHIDDPLDQELQAGLWDKYMQTDSLTDNFMTFYSKVANILLQKHPDSKALIGFLAYSNITLPPQRQWVAARPLVAYLAPIDIDPNHGMDSPDSPPQQEYGAMMDRWAQLMQGRVVIYDYDQGMLVWRDLPDPSYQSFEQDVKHYRSAGILGVDTESRGALATTFINLYLRGQLMWNPDASVDEMLQDFYPKFYGPAAVPMEKYWSAIFNAWNNTIVTEHEYFVIPAIYTPDLVKQLGVYLNQAEDAIAPLKESGRVLSRNEKLYIDRMDFTRHGYEVICLYTAMSQAAASQADYVQAAKIGQQGLAAQQDLAKLNPLFTTRVVGIAAQSEKNGAAWWPGEVAQYGELAKLTDGEKGTLIDKTPLEWAFRPDPHDTGLASGWAYQPVDLSFWNTNKNNYSLETRKDYPTSQWGMLRTDEYMQAQGIRYPDSQNYTGYYWYNTQIQLTKKQLSGQTHLMFPGLFNQCWLYINGNLVAHRDYQEPWWLGDYKFEWDVDVSQALHPGANSITLRGVVPSHMGGIFRRPFLYRAVG